MTFDTTAAGMVMILALGVLSVPIKITAVVAPYETGSDLANPAPRRHFDGFDPRPSGAPYWPARPREQLFSRN